MDTHPVSFVRENIVHQAVKGASPGIQIRYVVTNFKIEEEKMTVSLPAHKTEESNQLEGNSLPEKVQTQIGQLEDLVARRRRIRADVIKLLREIFQTDLNRVQVFGDYYDKAHRYFAKNPWIKDTHLGSDSTLLKLLREVQKNYSS